MVEKKVSDPAVLKRALAGQLPAVITNVLKSDDIDYDLLRSTVYRFFVDDEIKLAFLDIIDRAECLGIPIWENIRFQQIFKRYIILQANKGIWRLRDTFVILASMVGGYKPKSQENVVSLEDIYGRDDWNE